MPTHEDLIALARICLRQALTVRNVEQSAEFFRLAHEYECRAAEMRQLPHSQFGPKPANEAAK
jgi:hypothetical protein